MADAPYDVIVVGAGKSIFVSDQASFNLAIISARSGPNFGG